MTYVGLKSLSQICARQEMTGSLAIMLAEKAHAEGRAAEARGLVELAYRLFDEAADVKAPAGAAFVADLHPV